MTLAAKAAREVIAVKGVAWRSGSGLSASSRG